MTNFNPPSDPVDPIRTTAQIFGFWRDAVREWHKRNEAPLHSKDVLYDIVRKHSDAESTQDNPSWMISKAADVGLMEQFSSAGTYKLWLPELSRVIEVAGTVVFTPEQLQELLLGTPNWPFDINDEGVTGTSVITSIALSGAALPSDASEPATDDEGEPATQEVAPNPFDPETYTLDIELTDDTPKEIRRLALHLVLWRTATPSSDPDWRHIEYQTAKSVLRRHGVKKPETTLEGMSRGNEPRTKFSTEQVGVINPMKRLRPVERAHAGLWLRFKGTRIDPEALRATIRETLDYAANQVGGVTRVLLKYGWLSKQRGKFVLQRPMTLPEVEAALEVTEPVPAAKADTVDTAPEPVEPEPQQVEPPVNGSKSLLQMSREELEALKESLASRDPEPTRKLVVEKRKLIDEQTAHAAELEEELAKVRAQIEQEQAKLSLLEEELDDLESTAAANTQALGPVQFHLDNWDMIHAGVPNLPS